LFFFVFFFDEEDDIDDADIGSVPKMNAEVATDSLNVLNRHIAHMAESVIQSSASTTTNSKSVDDCGQLMSIWHPIMCRSQMYRGDHAAAAAHDHPEPSPSVHNNKIQRSSVSASVSVTHPATPSGSSSDNGKSIPVHCVVMNTSTPCYVADVTQGDDVSKMTEEEEASVDVDSYAIIPASTLFASVVPTVLRKLGYSEDVAFNATGWLIMKNWRPLSLTQIASSQHETVGGILGELTTLATLRIYIRKNNNHYQNEIKNKVLRWLLSQSQHVLTSSRFPLDEKWQQKMIQGERPATPSADTQRQFESWFQQEMIRQSLIQGATSSGATSCGATASGAAGGAGGRNNEDRVKCHSPTVNDVVINDMSLSRDLTPRVRMRTTFDPEQELPRLQRWFSENQHPTRFQLQLYVQELNELDSRRGRKPLDVSNLVYWFKNARAAFKRAEMRNQSECSAGNPVAVDWNNVPSVIHPANLERTGEGSSDDADPRLDDDDAVDEEDDDEEDMSSASERSRHSTARIFDSHPLKTEPDSHHETPSPIRARHDDDQSSLGGDSDSADSAEDFAENLSLAKNPMHSITTNEKQGGGFPSTTTGGTTSSASSSQANDYYGAFPLGLAHAQLNPHGLVYMTSPYLQGIGSSLLPSAHHHHHLTSTPTGGGGGLDPLSLTSSDDRRKRNRTFIDPVTEVPRLEHWFSMNTHPSHSLVLRYTDELNRQPYRLKFPKLEPKNVQFWFKNRRAKCKRLKLSL